jgi:hypothetical protein
VKSEILSAIHPEDYGPVMRGIERKRKLGEHGQPHRIALRHGGVGQSKAPVVLRQNNLPKRAILTSDSATVEIKMTPSSGRPWQLPMTESVALPP